MHAAAAIAEIVHGTRHHPQDETILRVVHDSRDVRPGDLFVALPGERTDGHRFLDDAFSSGAVAAMVSRTDTARINAVNLICVPDVPRALIDWARACRNHSDAVFVGITGTNGKTTTRRLLEHLLSEHCETYTAPRNFNTEIGLPLALINMPRASRIGLFELGIDHVGDMRTLTSILRPSIGLVTGVGPGHLDHLGDVETVANEKWDLVRDLPRDGWCVVNADPEALRIRFPEAPCELLSVGREHGDIRVRVLESVPRLLLELHPSVDPTEARRASPRKSAGLPGLPGLSLESPLLGGHHALNVSLAALAARHLGVTTEDIVERCATFVPPAHRLQDRPADFGTVLDDAYNANPPSTAAALRVLTAYGEDQAQRIFVFGEMLGLGDTSETHHVRILALARNLGIDRIIPIGHMASQACGVSETADAVDTIRAALAKDRPNIVLIKGSRALGLEHLIEELCQDSAA